jgi:hypothetical protein
VKRIAFTGVVAGATLLLAGCAGGDQQTDWSDYYRVLHQSFSQLGSKAVTRDRAAAVPYASMGYRLNGGPEALVVLGTDNAGEELWTSGAHIVIVTRDGRVIRTVGLPHDLGRWAPATGPSLTPPAIALGAPQTVTLTADFPDVGSYSSTITCRMAAVGPETVTILGRNIATIRVNENCYSHELKWQFRNSYWVDAEHFVWRSIQHIHPKGDMLETEVFRPPSQ